MKIAKQYVSEVAERLVRTNELAAQLEPYFLLLDEIPFVVFGFDVEEYSTDAPLLPKGRDGMSP